MNRLRTFILTMGLLSGIIGHAHDFEIDGVFYNIISATELKVAVTYQGDDYWSQDEYSGVVTIPSAVTYKNNTYNVVNIASRAFSNCSNLITVEISQGVRSIDGWAFEYCNNLTDIIIPSGMVSIGTCAFLECKSLTSINIPDGVISIGKTAFSGCDKLTSINLPDGVRSIGDNTFFNCSSLVSITIPESVTSIGDNVFYNCTSLREVIMEDGNETLSLGNKNGWQSLFLDSPIETLYLGRNLSFSDNSPFHSKKELKSLTIGDKVTEIASCTFYECTNIDILTLPNSVENIGNDAFYGCNGLTSVIMGSGIYSIGSQAFFYCSSLTGLTIPESVTSIEGGAFHGCSSLSYVVIGNKVSSIGSHAFAYCTNLIDLTIGSSVSNIGNYAFDGCNEIERIYALNTKAITCDESIFATDAYNNAILYTPTDRVFAYEKATPWNKFQIEPMKKFTVTYMVDGKVYEVKEVECASEISLIDEPIKEGHTFSGWSEVPETMPANDITVYGTFTANKYLITFKIDDEVIFSAPIEYGTSIVAPEAPEKDGYSFDGWIEMPETMPAHDVIVYGTFTKLKVETIVINDSDFSFSMEENTECGEIIYTRTFNNTDWQALYIPFEITYEDICDDFEIADINNVHQYDHNEDGKTDETIIEAFKVTSGTLEANYPYLIRAKEAGEKTIVVTDVTLYATEENSIDCSSVREKFTFTGTYSSLSSAELPQNEGYYTLIEGEWQPVTEAMALGAFRFYLKVDNRSGAPAAEARSIRMRIIGENGEDDATGIDNLESTDNDGKTTIIYDLQGRKVLNTETVQEGVYIINGKKVVIK